jgi:hypothetical protein
MKRDVLFINKIIPNSRLVYSAILFILIFLLSLILIDKNKQLGLADGAAEEYFFLGRNLHYTGNFFPNDENIPFVFRPPGYSFFIASVLKIAGIPKADLDSDKVKSDYRIIYNSFSAIYFAQCLLLGLSSVFLFLILSKFLSKGSSFILSFIFGCNPHLIILTGFIRYDILHVFLTIISCYVLIISIDKLEKNPYIMILVGLTWGLTTIVRPMTLILPLFVLVIFLVIYKNHLRLLLKAIAFFMIGMTCIIGPYTIRNYYLTKRIIPVNAQAGIAFSVSTSTKLPPISGDNRWSSFNKEYALPIFKEITNSPKHNYYLLIKHNIKLEDKHKQLAYENLKRQPFVYLYNVLQHFYFFNFGYTSNYIEMFLKKNLNDKENRIESAHRKYSISLYSKAFKYYMNMLTIFGVLGVFIALKKELRSNTKHTIYSDTVGLNDSKISSLLVPISIYLCFCVAHSISYMDYMYYYIKLPFLYIFFGYLIDNTNKSLSEIYCRLWNVPISFILISIMIVFGLGITYSILFC